MTLRHRHENQGLCYGALASAGLIVLAATGCAVNPSSDCRANWTCPASEDGAAGAFAQTSSGMAGASARPATGGAPSMSGARSGTSALAVAGAAGTADAPTTVGQLELSVETSVRLLSGSKKALRAVVARNGHRGPLTLSVSGLPTGVTASSVVLQDGASQAELVFDTSGDTRGQARGGPFPISVSVASNEAASARTESPSVLYVAREAGKIDLSVESDAMTGRKISAGGADVPRDACVDSMGRIWLAGSGKDATNNERAWVVRLTKTAALDPEFDTKRELVGFGNPASLARTLLWTEQGTYVGGTASSDRVNFVRKLDGTGGYVSDTNLTAGSAPVELLPLADGLLSLLGSGGIVVRLTTDGTQLPSTAWSSPPNLGAAAITVDANGRIAYGKLGTNVFTFGRLLATGAVDPSFGTSGELSVNLGTPVRIVSLRTTQAGQIIALVESHTGPSASETEVRLVALTVDGFLDSSFGSATSGGAIKLTPRFGKAYGAEIQADGKLVVVYSETESTERYRLLRFSSPLVGELDPTFAGGTTVDLSAEFSGLMVDGMAPDPYGQRAVIYGHTPMGLALAKIWL